jgi:hypothetical protein
MMTAPNAAPKKRMKAAYFALVRAAREQCHEDHQVPRREKQLIGLDSRRLGHASDEAQAM